MIAATATEPVTASKAKRTSPTATKGAGTSRTVLPLGDRILISPPPVRR